MYTTVPFLDQPAYIPSPITIKITLAPPPDQTYATANCEA